MIRCISVDSAFPGKHGKTQTYSIIRIHIVNTAPQSRPVWAYSRALMMPRPLANCWVLAARTNINGGTCKQKLHRGATELTAQSGYPEHNVNTCMCAEKQSTSGAYRFLQFEYLFLSLFCLLSWRSKFEQAHRSSAHLKINTGMIPVHKTYT